MAVETHPTYAKQWAIVDFEPDGDRRVARFLTSDLDIRRGMAQLIQLSANREGDPMKRHRIGWFSERRRELFVFQHFFDLFLREQPGARVFDFGKKRQFLQMKNQSYVFGVAGQLRKR